MQYLRCATIVLEMVTLNVSRLGLMVTSPEMREKTRCNVPKFSIRRGLVGGTEYLRHYQVLIILFGSGPLH